MNIQAALFDTPTTPLSATSKRRQRDPLSLVTQLIRAGQKPAGRGPVVTRCPHCHTEVLVGHDTDGIPTTLDTRPLTTTGEAIALIANQHTYDIHTRHGALVIGLRRRHLRIANHPAGTPRLIRPADVVTLHRCGHTTPDALCAPTQLIKPPPAATTSQCPY